MWSYLQGRNWAARLFSIVQSQAFQRQIFNGVLAIKQKSISIHRTGKHFTNLNNEKLKFNEKKTFNL